MAVLALLVVIAALGLTLSDPGLAGPTEVIQCTSCHEDLVPFAYTLEAPSEVPIGEPFDLVVTVSNDEMHAVYDPTVMLTIDDPDGLVVDSGEPGVAQYNEQGTLAFRTEVTFPVPVSPGAQRASFDLDGSGGRLDDLDLVISGPEGGGWSATGAGVDESITLDAADIQEGGYGTYQVTVSHPAGVRRVTFSLGIEVEYGDDSMMLTGPDLQGGESHAFTFSLRGTVRGPNGVTVVVSGTAVHLHESGDLEETDFTEEGSVSMEVGDELVYGSPQDDGGGGSWDDLLAGGRYLGILAALLLGVSIVASGHLRWFPRRQRVHCWSSYAMVATFVVHWTMLWAGPYGSTLGGIVTGSVLLVSIVLLTLTGARPVLLEGRLPGLTSRELHRYLTYLVIIVLVLHAVLNGSDLAFIRESFTG